MGPTAARGNLTAGPDVTCGEEIQLLLQHKIIYADYLERGHDPSTCAGKEKAFGMERSVRNNLLQLVHSNNSPFILYSALDSVLDNIAGYPNSDDREVHKQLALHVAACLNTYEETYDASRTENLYTLDMALMVQKDVVRKLVDMATRAASFLVSEREFFSSFHMACVCKRIIEHLDGTLIVFDRPIDPGYRQRKRMLLWILAYSTAQVTAGEVPSNDFANGVMKRLRRKYGYRIPPREELDNAALAISWANTAETEGSEIILEDLPMGIFG
ncbi:hypothetical protein QBC35DRAFT_454898 [Podospora australis]|uniref:Uncharacterized protein n=1 Tax=Podospora australis TaxID=1536484 RepID=A0AAN6WMG1_9PEZI|nr:hypothetical protein QBC35DRAFT_454898 [Podospora australis]